MLRFDGLYQSPPREMTRGVFVREYMRFFPDGVMARSASEADVREVAAALTRDGGHGSCTTYTLDGDVVRAMFEIGDRSDEAWFKTIELEGRFDGDVLRMKTVTSYPLINDYGPTGAHNEYDCTFVAVG